MGIVSGKNIVSEALLEKQFRRHVAPLVAIKFALLHRLQEFILRDSGKGMEGGMMLSLGYGFEGGKPAPPCLSQRWQARLPIAVAFVVCQFLVNHCGDWNWGAIIRLRYDAVTDGA